MLCYLNLKLLGLKKKKKEQNEAPLIVHELTLVDQKLENEIVGEPPSELYIKHKLLVTETESHS